MAIELVYKTALALDDLSLVVESRLLSFDERMELLHILFRTTTCCIATSTTCLRCCSELRYFFALLLYNFLQLGLCLATR